MGDEPKIWSFLDFSKLGVIKTLNVFNLFNKAVGLMNQAPTSLVRKAEVKTFF